MAALLDKLLAIWRRDLLIALRYRAGFWMPLLALLAEMVAFYYLARAIGPGFRPEGMDYFSFLLIGTGFYGFFVVGISAFVSAVHDAQVSGTMEVLMTTATPPPVIVFLTAASVFLERTLYLVFYLGLGLWLFRVPLHLNLLGCLVVFLLSLAVAVALGIAAAALQIRLQKGSAVVWLFSSLAWLLTGMTFPVAALPPWLQKLAALIPVTHSLDGLRMAMVKGASWSDLAAPLVALFVFAALLLPLSLWLFARALRRARIEGTLSFY